MANNKLIAAAIAGLLAATLPLAAFAADEAKSTEANSCSGEKAKEGEANSCNGEAKKEEEKKDETKTEEAVPAPAEKQ
jgi:hypothetical protein